MSKKVFYMLLILVVFFVFDIKCYAVDDPNKLSLYGFGDTYEDDDFLTVHNTRRCYVDIKDIPISEADNIKLTVKDESIAEVRFIIRGSKFNPVITADISGKKLGTTDIIASLTYKGVNYTSKITTTVHQSNYRIWLGREDNKRLEGTVLEKGESLKLNTLLVQGMSFHRGYVSATWSSSNNSVLSVKDGLITANRAGTATITAKYVTEEGETISDSTVIEVKDTDAVPSIRFFLEEPGPAMALGIDDKYNVGLENVPISERKNISFKVENENIAKITNVQYGKNGADATAIVKYLSAGKTKLIATINYNGKIYSSSYDIDVKIAKIKFLYEEPGPVMTIGYNDKYSVELENMPVFLKNDIKFRIENEKIAQIVNVQYRKNGADAVATVKYLSAGNTKLIATIDYGGKIYSATYDIRVKNSEVKNPVNNNLNDKDKEDKENKDSDTDNKEDDKSGDKDKEVDKSETNESDDDSVKDKDIEKNNSKTGKLEDDNSKDSHTNKKDLLIVLSVITGVIILVIVAIIIKRKKVANV
ncbi:MAG TPA: hypothetical protein DCE23_00755 [Firmicutes bacterium]|nr:hypothetical protein [Bacillota bacterium]